MKHAFLIIAHNEYPVLEVLLSMLDDERNDIYLHIDKRATELFQQIKKVKMQKAGFYLIENPIKVYWGDISQVQVEYLLFETALSHGPYALLSFIIRNGFAHKKPRLHSCFFPAECR